jgi:hypothetical protein
MQKTFEKYHSYLFGFLSGITFLLWGRVPSFLGTIFPLVIIINSINLGFLANALSMVTFSEKQTPMVQKLWELKRFDDLVHYIIAAIQWNLIVAGISIAGIMLFELPNIKLVHLVSSVWLAAGVTGFLNTSRVLTVFFEAWKSATNTITR